MGCTCLFKNPEIDFNMAKDNKSLLRTKDGIKLKSGRKYKTGLFRTLSQSSLIEINNFRKEVLENINKHRKEHGVYPLEMNKEINEMAQKFAEELSHINELDYSENMYKGGFLGESIYKSFKKITPENLVDILYEECSEFDFENDNPEPNHFSQMVWKSTKLFGLGMAEGPSGCYFFVLNYFPIGNIPGQYLTNVFPKNSNSIQIGDEKNNNNLKDSKNFNNFSYINNLFNSNNKISKKNSENNKSNKNRRRSCDNKNDNYMSDFNDFCLDALRSHNKYRKIHHSPDLKLNKDICNIAQKYAENLAKNNIMQHSDNTYKGDNLGENIFMCRGIEATGEYVTNSWYEEIKIHNFNGDYQNGSGHFTQVVWKESKEVGFGISKNKSGYTYVVGNYFPAGNILGNFRQNVFKE